MAQKFPTGSPGWGWFASTRPSNFPAPFAPDCGARYNPHLRATLIRATGFFVFASAYWALLPLLARNQVGGGPALYGMLLGAIGTGAVAAAFALPRLTRQCGGPPRFDHSLEEPV